MSSDSTNIDSLPMQTKDNIQLNVSEQPVTAPVQSPISQPSPNTQDPPSQQQSFPPPPSKPDIVPSEKSKMISFTQGLQEAHQQGATRLNPRDIPMKPPKFVRKS